MQSALQLTLRGAGNSFNNKTRCIPSLQASVVSWVGNGCIPDTPVLVVSAKATFFLEDRLSKRNNREEGPRAGVREAIC